MNRIDIFKISVFQEMLNHDNEAIYRECLSERGDAKPACSNVGGWQSQDLREIPPILTPLFSDIQRCANNVAQHLQLKPLVLANTWFNLHKRGNFNWEHTHPLSVISGVYYVRVPKDSGLVEFIHPADGIMCQGNAVYDSYSELTAPAWKKPVKEGLLLMFPGWLPHRVYPHLNEEEERVSISFNFVHSGNE